MYIFPSQVGIPAVLTDPSLTPTTFSYSMEGWNGPFATHCIITGISANTQGNYQFLMTLRNYTYVYVFGERMGDFTVSGVSLNGLCGSLADGMTWAIEYYNRVCISSTGQPITLSMGGYGTYAFLVGGSFDYSDPANRLGRFSYSFKTVTDPN